MEFKGRRFTFSDKDRADLIAGRNEAQQKIGARTEAMKLIDGINDPVELQNKIVELASMKANYVNTNDDFLNTVLQEAILKARGVYGASEKEINELLQSGD